MRAEAMRRPMPLDWKPAVKDEVFLPARSPFLTVQTGMIAALFDDGLIAKVRYLAPGYSDRCYDAMLAVKHLRPTGLKMRTPSEAVDPKQKRKLPPKAKKANQLTRRRNGAWLGVRSVS